MTKQEFLDVNRIYCGDASMLLDKIRKNSIHLVFTSPPYNAAYNYENYDDSLTWEEYETYLKKVLIKIHNVLVSGGRLAINVPFAIKHRINKKVKFLAPLIANLCNEIGYLDFEFITWHKGKNENHFQGNNTAWGSWKSPSHPVFRGLGEVIMVFSKNKPKLDGNKENIDITSTEFKNWTKNIWYLDNDKNIKKNKNREDIWFIPNNKNKNDHPCPFPDELARRVIKLYSYQKNTVLDPFNGVGTSTYMANLLKRNYIGFDLSEKYCEMARKRIDNDKKLKFG